MEARKNIPTICILDDNPSNAAIHGDTHVVKPDELSDTTRVYKDYQTITENSPLGLYVIQNGMISYINQRATQILAYNTPDQLVGKTLWNIVHPDDRPHVELKICTTQQHPFKNNVRLLKKDGSSIWVSMQAEASNYLGKPAHIGYFIESKPTLEIERSLQETNEKFRTIINEIEDAVSELDLKGNILFINRAACKMWNITADSVLGTNYKAFVDEQTAHKIFKVYNEVYHTGALGKRLTYEVIKDNRRRVQEDSISVIRNVDGHIIGFRVVYRDITDRIKAQKKLIEQRTRLEAIFSSVQDAIITVDPDLNVIAANASTKNICGIDKESLIGKQFPLCFNTCERSCFKVLQQTLENKTSHQESHIECHSKLRHHQIVNISSSPLIAPEGHYMGAVLVIRDVTLLRDLERELQERHQYQNIVGKSQKMQDIYKLLEKLSSLDTTVLVTGESGTGKELIAKAIHANGCRTDNPLITVNCSALAESLLESELFGHIKGAFTGAIRDKEGRFQAAHGGTIVLDEIGDISPLIQLKLLRVLQEKECERVGENISQKVDVRIIACTNKNLKEMVKNKLFREDLYYRLKVVEIHLPPLRERIEDVPLLADHFRILFNKRFKKNIVGFSNDVLARFMDYNWPGNIRELLHAIERAFVLCQGKVIPLKHLPSELLYYKNPGDVNKASSKDPLTEAQEILNALKRTHWKKTETARLLGISRQTLYRRMYKYKISPDNSY